MKIPLPARGVDLLSDETGLPEGAVRSADNVDIRANGHFTRRKGYSIAAAGAGFHSVRATAAGMLVGRNSGLYRLDTASYAMTLLCDMGSDAPIDFAEHNGHTYCINRSSFWWIPAGDTAARQVGVREPDSLPVPTAHPYGALAAGRYGVAVSRVDDRGEESRTVFVGAVDLPAGGGIMLAGATLDAAASYRIYLTPPDGDVLYLSETFPGVLTQFIVSRPPDGATRATQHLQPMPAGGDFVRGHAGRLYVARDNVVLFSEPHRPHLHDPRYNFVQFVGAVRFIEPVAGGIYVGDDRGVWFLPGNDPAEFQMRKASDAVAVHRSSTALSGAHFNKDVTQTDMDVAVWLSTEGYMIGRPSGDVVSLHPDRVRVAAGLEGRSRFLVRHGVKQIITLVAATTAAGHGVAIDTTGD